jgi:predicted metalloprotease with PDZ domain
MRSLIDNQIKRVARRILSVLSIAAIAVASISSLHAQQNEQSAKSDDHASLYEITINEATPLLAHVRAKMHAAKYIEMNTNCPNYDYPEGWASFVRNLTVTANDSQVPIDYVSKSRWELDLASPGPVTVEYDVDLSFTTIQWDVGNEQAGYFDGDAVYLVSKALFIHGDVNESFVVRFNLPNSWKISVPWLRIDDSDAYLVPDLERLLENSLVYGGYGNGSFMKLGFVFEFALLGDAGESVDAFREVFDLISAEYMSLFPDTVPSKLLVSMFYADQDDGESFFNSNAFTLSKKIEPDGAIIWANQMAHELFHYWNSDLIRSANYEDRQWFSEGFAEYYSNLTLYRNGIIDDAMFRRKAEKIAGLYQNFKWRNPNITLKDAGKNKGTNRFAVYNGGWVAALALDTLIIEKSNGERNLDDFMRRMFDKYTATPYDYDDLVTTASEVAGDDISFFFDKYIHGTETIPIEEIFNKIGYKVYDVVYEAEMYLVPQDGGGLRKYWLRIQD